MIFDFQFFSSGRNSSYPMSERSYLPFPRLHGSKKDDKHTPHLALDKTDHGTRGENQGTLIMDVICAPANIRYPQYISLLNEVREKP